MMHLPREELGPPCLSLTGETDVLLTAYFLLHASWRSPDISETVQLPLSYNICKLSYEHVTIVFGTYRIEFPSLQRTRLIYLLFVGVGGCMNICGAPTVIDENKLFLDNNILGIQAVHLFFHKYI